MATVTLPFEQTPISIYASGIDGDGTFLDLVAVVDDYQTCRFVHGSYQPGDFEITINKNSNYALLFTRQRLIQIGDDAYKAGVIELVQNEVGPDGALSEKITIKGREVWSYLDRRIVIPPTGEAYYALPSTTPVETVIKTLVGTEMGASATANRKDLSLTVEADAGLGTAYVLSARYDNLLTIVSNAALATNSTVFSYLNHSTKRWVLGFSLGLDRTTSQTTNPQAVFSTSRETITKATLKDVDQGYRNLAVVGGQGEGAARTIVTVPASEPTGVSRRELFVDARDLKLTASLQNRGEQKLAENQWIKYIDSDVLAFSQLVYGQDYSVGDEVTIQQFGLTQNAFVTSAEEYWAPGQYNLKIGFDRSSPTLPNQVSGIYQQMVKTMNATETPLGGSAVPAGTIITSAAISTPAGYLACDASSVSKTTYSALWAALHADKGTFTVTIASPAVVTLSGHGLATGDNVYLTTTGSLPTGLTANTNYFVIFVSSSTFRLATTLANALAGTAINTSGSQSGTHSMTYSPYGIASSTNFTLPDARESVLYGTGTRGSGITAHDVAVLGQFKDDQMQGHWHSLTVSTSNIANTGNNAAFGTTNVAGSTNVLMASGNEARPVITDGTNGPPRTGTVTRGKQLGVNTFIKY